jgi:membrane protease YdiL (CAAX protease family)
MVMMIKKNFYEILWMTSAFITLVLVFILKEVDFPLFSMIWLIVSILISINQGIKILTFEKNKTFNTVKATVVFLVLSWLLIAIIELLTSSYGMLFELIESTGSKDISFSWLSTRSEGRDYLYFFLFTFFVTIFAEEAFFRGYLLKTLEEKYNKNLANILQAILFSLPQIIVAFMMPTLEGVTFVVMYSFIIYGLMSGYFAQKTGNIWPGLIVATVNNFILTMWYFN